MQEIDQEYASLLNIDEVPAIEEQDRQFFQEVRNFLVHHGMEKRFGLSLLHKHFDLVEGEALVEFCDVENRLLSSRPVRNGEIVTGDVRPTNWRFDIPGVIAACHCYCHNAGGRHSGHEHK